MSTETAQARLTPRIPEQYATDAVFAAARPDEAVSAAIERPVKTALITGCSSGYGLEIARHFHSKGWNVIATMRTPREEVLPRSERLPGSAP